MSVNARNVSLVSIFLMSTVNTSDRYSLVSTVNTSAGRHRRPWLSTAASIHAHSPPFLPPLILELRISHAIAGGLLHDTWWGAPLPCFNGKVGCPLIIPTED
ncbi:hypothetical protein J6590_036289 [Homalodisca vitripennis]|nr:hypothetical protein J6590_036289 [Homalodisca vitripennis]